MAFTEKSYKPLSSQMDLSEIEALHSTSQRFVDKNKDKSTNLSGTGLASSTKACIELVLESMHTFAYTCPFHSNPPAVST